MPLSRGGSTSRIGADLGGRDVVRREACGGPRALRRVSTPGRPLSVSRDNCGSFGWVSDRRGYRYEPTDPSTGKAWPLAFRAGAIRVGRGRKGRVPQFTPTPVSSTNMCPGPRCLFMWIAMKRFSQPIAVGVFGITGDFPGGAARSEQPRRVAWKTGMSWCGAVRRGSIITASRPSNQASPPVGAPDQSDLSKGGFRRCRGRPGNGRAFASLRPRAPGECTSGCSKKVSFVTV